MLRTEQRLIASAQDRRDVGAGRVAPERVEALLAARPELAEEQRELVRRVTQSGGGIEVIRAAAGTGKTFALSVARDAWEAEGHRVFGCALAARAAVELQSQAGIDSCTIAQLRRDLERGYGLPESAVLVVDEAGMVGSRALAELADHAAETGSKLVLVGDDRQLPELDAGGGFRGLADRLGAIDLKDKRRQIHEWDREALGELRFGRVDAWADAYRDHGRIVAEPTADKLHATLVRDWWAAARDQDADVVMIAHRRADVALLNQLARERMRRDGRLASDELVTTERAFAVGDRVLARRNDRRLDIVNGSRATVVETDAVHHRLRIELEDGGLREINAPYLEEGHLDHGYAMTAHAAQGATVDCAFVLGSDALYREWAYTAMTRHRTEARFYVVSPGTTERTLPGLEPDVDPLSRDLRDVLHASRRKELATTIVERSGEAIEVPAPSAPAAPSERDVLERHADEARRLAEAIRTEAERLSRWKRRERDELLTLAETHEEAEMRWERAIADAEPATLVEASAPTASPDPAALRDLLNDPPKGLVRRIGKRPESLFERETWNAAAVELAASYDLMHETFDPGHAPQLDSGLDL